MEQDIVNNVTAALPGLIPVLYTLFVATGLDVVTGLWAAWSSGTFESKYIPEFISSHVVKRIAPILITLLAGVSVGGTDNLAGAGLLTLAGGEVAAYLASVIGSVKGNLTQGAAGTKGAPSSTVQTTTEAPPPVTDPVA